MKIVAFDLSLNATGFACDRGTEVLTPPKTHARGIARLRWIRGAVLDRVPPGALVLLEGYAYGRAHQAHQLGELGGVVRVALADAGVTWVDVQPSCLKRYSAGRGNASKDQVLAEAIRRLGFDGHSNDAADALWLRAMAHDHYGTPLVTMPQAHRAALVGVTWPQRFEAANKMTLQETEKASREQLRSVSGYRFVIGVPPPGAFR